MKRFLGWVVVAGAAAMAARAEKPSGAPVSAEAIKPIAKPIGTVQAPTPQINPNQIPGQQGPNFPAGQQTPDPKKPFENILPGGLQPGAVPRDTGGGAIDTLRPDRETLGLDQLNADDARRQPGFDPGRFGRRTGPGGAETETLVGALRGLTGKSNQERMSDRSRSFGAGLRPDSSTLPKTNPAGDEPNDGLGRLTSRERTNDGGSASTYTRSDGGTTTVYRDRGGAEVSREHRSRDSAGREVVTTHTGNQEVTEVTGGGHTVRVEAYGDARRGDYEVRTVVDGRPIHSGRAEGPVLTVTMASQTHDRLFRGTARDVDPDSPQGQGGGQVVGLGQKPKEPTMVEARNEGVGPGARPDENASAGVTSRLDVNVDLAGQPNPAEGRGGGGLGYRGRGYNPDDFVRPPRPSDP